MEYVNLGSSGLKVSRICLGTMTFGSPDWYDWVLDEEGARPLVKRALELGINFFDTADIYSKGVSEQVTGRLLNELAPRSEIILATKVFGKMNADDPNSGGLSRKHIMDAIDGSLSRLGMDYVDLYQIHRWDYETPIEETMEALHDVVKAGKARYIGASSMFAWQFAKAQDVAEKHGWTRFVSMQNHWNAIYREEEREMVPLCLDQGVGLMPWSPLARGVLAGNRRVQGEGETIRAKNDHFLHYYYKTSDDEVLDEIIDIANTKETTPAKVALQWLLSKQGVSAPVIGVTKMYQVEAAVESLELELDDEEIRRIEAPYVPHEITGHK